MIIQEYLLNQIRLFGNELLITAIKLFKTDDIEKIRQQTADILSDINGNPGLATADGEVYVKPEFYFRHGKEGTTSRDAATNKAACGLAVIKLLCATKSLNAGDITGAQKQLNDARSLHGSSIAGIEMTSEKSGMAVGKSKLPRPKKNPTNRSLTMEAMKKYRLEDHTIKEFIQSALNGNFDPLELTLTKGNVSDLNLIKTAKSTKYKLIWPDIKPTNVTPYSTLQDWFTDCLK
jgi:hypothetical protein